MVASKRSGQRERLSSDADLTLAASRARMAVRHSDLGSDN